MANKTNFPQFHTRLQRWYAAHGRRELPWRNTRDAYHIYVSEIMLQQTQVKTVLERFYHPFLKQFPTLTALAKAPREKVMKAWEGLGYYTRAANLHEAAKLVASSSPLPSTVEALIALPGIGKNTAHAIAAFAYRQPVPVMEANVKRVLCRIFALKTPSVEMLWKQAETLLDVKHPFDYNQAMMDIGAMVCTKRAPKCLACPANIICKGKKSPEAYPTKKVKKKIPIRERIIVVFQNRRGEVYLAPRKTKFLGGLYGFPEYATGENIIFQGKTYDLRRAKKLGHITQTYSHFTLGAEVVRLTARPMHTKHWHHINQLIDIPLSRADRKVSALL